MMPASLRRTALLWMTGLLALVGLLGAAAGYRFTYSGVSELLDGQMQQIALNVGGGLHVIDPSPRADEDPEDVFAVTIFVQPGVASYHAGPVLDIPAQARGFADVQAQGELWRVYTAGSGFPAVQVAQQWTVREEVAQNAALTASAPVLLMIPLSWFVVGWAMKKALRPLDALVLQIRRRAPEADAPISAPGGPCEVAPLVESFNGLIVRSNAVASAQRQFLADAAHELRTPLTALQIQLDVLSKFKNADNAAPLLALAKGVGRATLLINQLLHLARLDDASPTRHGPVHLAPLLTGCIADLTPLAHAKGIDLGLTRSTAERCVGARLEIETLFACLIENAVKYTQPGGCVDVGLRCVQRSVVFEVVDNGPGIPAAAVSRIFERFYRADNAPGIGSGLGLAIAARVAQRHDFALWVGNRTDGRSGVRAQVVMPVCEDGPGQAPALHGRRERGSDGRSSPTYAGVNSPPLTSIEP